MLRGPRHRDASANILLRGHLAPNTTKKLVQHDHEKSFSQEDLPRKHHSYFSKHGIVERDDSSTCALLRRATMQTDNRWLHTIFPPRETYVSQQDSVSCKFEAQADS